jgi:hypothetical protein
LHIVTASDLGQALVNYYWKIVQDNSARVNKLKGKLDNEDIRMLEKQRYLGIQMHDLPKGLWIEASVKITIAPKPRWKPKNGLIIPECKGKYMADFNPRKLQFFVLSTFDDLKKERQTAIEAILTAGHIPTGPDVHFHPLPVSQADQ